MKIGICTMYFKNMNYGANLQAYALRYKLESLGHDVEVITYKDITRLHSLLSSLKVTITNCFKKMSNEDKSIAPNVKKRMSVVGKFNQSIPHTRLYYSNTIKSANTKFDCFISGSDQVWNPNWINQYTGLLFVDDSKLTISYAASTGKINLDEAQQVKLKKALDKTKFISIREKESIPALQALTAKTIDYVLDPTLLMERNEWDRLCAKRLVQDDYLFCYYLGCNNENVRNVAREYAKEKNLKLVTMPFLNGKYRKVDDGFGDIQLYDVSPADFISLIKYASFVMTDSFHGTVFSHIYEVPFSVSGGGKNEMGCRMMSLTEMFGTENRYFKEHEDVSVDKLRDLDKEPMVLDWENYHKMRAHSLQFLKGALNDNR